MLLERGVIVSLEAYSSLKVVVEEAETFFDIWYNYEYGKGISGKDDEATKVMVRRIITEEYDDDWITSTENNCRHACL